MLSNLFTIITPSSAMNLLIYAHHCHQECWDIEFIVQAIARKACACMCCPKSDACERLALHSTIHAACILSCNAVTDDLYTACMVVQKLAGQKCTRL